MASALTSSRAEDDNAATAEDQPFRLLDLPPELWSRIGKMAIDDTATEVDFRQPQNRSHIYRHSAITRTCRALREELLPYFYKHEFKARCKLSNYTSNYRLGNLLKEVGPSNRRLIQGVRVKTGLSPTPYRVMCMLLECGWKFRFDLRQSEPFPCCDEGCCWERWHYVEFL